jgi:hypothetical protein
LQSPRKIYLPNYQGITLFSVARHGCGFAKLARKNIGVSYNSPAQQVLSAQRSGSASVLPVRQSCRGRGLPLLEMEFL